MYEMKKVFRNVPIAAILPSLFSYFMHRLLNFICRVMSFPSEVTVLHHLSGHRRLHGGRAYTYHIISTDITLSWLHHLPSVFFSANHFNVWSLNSFALVNLELILNFSQPLIITWNRITDKSLFYIKIHTKGKALKVQWRYKINKK